MDTSSILRPLILVAALFAGACNPIYKAPVQQGNVLDQDMIDQLRPDMSKRQVELVLGTPSLKSAFHQDRWDYLYTLRIGRGELQEQRLTVIFIEDKLARLEGDWKPSQADVIRYKNKKTETAEQAAAKMNVPEREAAEYISAEETAAEDIAAEQVVDESDDVDQLETGDD